MIVIGDQEVGLDAVCEVATTATEVEASQAALARLAQRRQDLEDFREKAKAAKAPPIYGVETGFGSNVGDRVHPDDLAKLQENLIRSHAICVGEPAPVEVVRAAMFLRAVSLLRGHSGVRPDVVTALTEFLNRGVTPVVPRYGTVSASGDLAPLSHIALALMGEGEVFVGGQRRLPTAEALAIAGQLQPLRLQAKEGLALNNGVQYSVAFAALAAHRMSILVRTAAIATALTAQVMLGADTPFDEELHAVRPHPGSVRVARWVYALMAGSPIRDAHRAWDLDGEVQDPYNLRCAAQVLGPALELVDRAQATLKVEANSATDNPLFFPLRDADLAVAEFAELDKERFIGTYGKAVSGGHFHGMPVAVDAYGLLQAAALIAQLSNLRCARYVDPKRNKGLGPQLKWPGDPEYCDDSLEFGDLERRRSTESGMMIHEYTTAGLTNWLWSQSMPSHLMSIPTDSGQEDHVSMAANVAMRAYDATRRVADVLAIELAFAHQAAEIRKVQKWWPSRRPEIGRFQVKPAQRLTSPVSRAILEEIGRHVPRLETDRYTAPEIAALAEVVHGGGIVASASHAGRSSPLA